MAPWPSHHACGVLVSRPRFSTCRLFQIQEMRIAGPQQFHILLIIGIVRTSIGRIHSVAELPFRMNGILDGIVIIEVVVVIQPLPQAEFSSFLGVSQ